MHRQSVSLLIWLMLLSSPCIHAQAIDPNRSAKAAVASDARFVDVNIEHNKDMMFLVKKGIDRATDARIREMAPQMLEDRSAMLYSMEQLKAAGSGSAPGTKSTAAANKQAAIISQNLGQVSGGEFDSLWVASMLQLHEEKFQEYTQAKETVTNSQLKMAISDALPILRKYSNQLRIIQKDLARTAAKIRKEAAKKKAG